MLKASTDITSKVSVINRLVFASSVLPSDCPKFWEIVSCFATNNEDTKIQSSLTPEKAKTFIQNLQFLEPAAFTSHQQLALELQSFAGPSLTKALGVVLISPRSNCKVCNSSLLVKADRPSKIVLYTDQFGTIQGTHYRKICKRFRVGCSFVQHYGYHTNGDENLVYDSEFKLLPYFISTRETGFELSLLERFDIEILIGQLSYKQRSDIYNLQHGYDKAKKTLRTSTQQECLPQARFALRSLRDVAVYALLSTVLHHLKMLNA